MPSEQEEKISVVDAWNKSRSGAWAGRGFHYQHLISTLILIHQWTGLAPSGYLVPEGLEDCVVELPDCELWMQIKSRKEGVFGNTEVQQIYSSIEAKVAKIKGKTKRNISVVLEQPCTGLKKIDLNQIFENKNKEVYVCASPGDECVTLITTRLDTAEIIAEGIVSDLYKLVASVSEENASLSFDRRRRISTTEVERRIFERLEAEDPSAIDRALAVGVIEPIDFNNPINEPAFYQGVKVAPGHVAAGLVFDRPIDRKNVTRILRQQRHVLVCGPSGAGKSALLWSSANDLASQLRWYQVTGRAVAADAETIIRFLRARRPAEISPIGLAFDEVSSANSDLWDVLVQELRSFPSVYFVGSIRKEDVGLIANQADTEFIEISMNEKLAESVWRKLRAENLTSWGHWREPFEQSENLMLEYVHLLTQGKRLAFVIEDQVRQRQKEGRHEELAIIRSTSAICARGGEVQASKLFDLLDIKPESASQALVRLIDEHLVREARPGVMGGLHVLRSQALCETSHDQIVFFPTASLWKSLLATTNETLPRVIQSILIEVPDEDENSILYNLAELLSSSQDIDVWTSILTGLGLATLERKVSSFIRILEQHDVQRAQWSLASMFSDPQIDIPDLTMFEQWQYLRDAILAFRALPTNDLRHKCVEQLPEESSVPSCQDLRQANKLLSCLAPICGGKPVQITISPTFVGDEEYDIKESATFLSTAYLISSKMAKNFVDGLGGEQILFNWFKSQIPWVTRPEIDPTGEHGRTVRSDMYYVVEHDQQDPHKTVCDICEMLIAISPESDAAASDAVTPLGSPITVGDYQPWSKNMPRKNIAAKTRVAWNVAFRQILLARSASYSLTDYTRLMADLVRRTEKVFRSSSEKWIKGKSITNAHALAEEINQIIQAVNSIAYTTPEKPAHEMTRPAANAGEDDSLGALLTGVLGNLLRRMNKIPAEEKPKPAASFAGSLAMQARDHEQSTIWRANPNPPLRELNALGDRLEDVACILHEFAYDNSQPSIQRIVGFAKKGSLGKAIRSAAQRCRLLAEQRFNRKLKSLESSLKEKGWRATCWTRQLDEIDSVYWPAREVAISVDIQNFETDATYIDNAFSLGQQHLDEGWRYRVVPVINGFIVAPLALLPSSNVPLPDQDFTEEWQQYIDYPFLSSQFTQRFDEALAACVQLSAIVTCCNLEQLHQEEDDAISHAIDAFQRNRDFISEVAENTDSEYLVWAYDYLKQTWNQVIDEFEAAKAGRSIAQPLCMAPHLALTGQADGQPSEIAAMRILILQAECLNEVQISLS